MTKQLLTPIGTLRYPHLEKARDFKGDGNFKYDCQLELEGAEAATMIQQVDELLAESGKTHKAARLHPAPYAQVQDQEGNAIPGKYRFRFKVNAKTETKSGDIWDRRPKLFDALGKPIEPGIGIGNGTKARISFTPYAWKNPSGAGLTLQPTAVQIVELVEFKHGTAEQFGFGQVEGGYAKDDDAGQSDGGDAPAASNPAQSKPAEF